MNAPQSKALGPNPKDLFGAVKPSFTKLPAVAIAHGAHAMMDGAVKYGAYNWRDKKVIASIYVDAASRHLLNWFEGQETAADSEVHHLGHAIACVAILLDAQETGNLIDDRPVCGSPDVLNSVLDRLTAVVKRRAERKRVDQSWANAALADALPRASGSPTSADNVEAPWKRAEVGDTILYRDDSGPRQGVVVVADDNDRLGARLRVKCAWVPNENVIEVQPQETTASQE